MVASAAKHTVSCHPPRAFCGPIFPNGIPRRSTELIARYFCSSGKASFGDGAVFYPLLAESFIGVTLALVTAWICVAAAIRALDLGGG